MPRTRPGPRHAATRRRRDSKVRIKDHTILERLMHEQGWSYRKLADACGLASHTLIYQLAKGKRPGCRPAVALCIAENLDVTPQYLFVTSESSHTGRTGQRDGSKP